MGLALANVIAQVGIIVTGGLVRLTGSGLGCSTWPLCEPGQFAPVFHAAATYHPFVEFGNRVMTGVLVVISVLLILAVVYNPKRTKEVKGLAWTVLGLIALQAIIGGITVLVDLNPAIVAGHMFISLSLVAIATLLHYRISNTPRAGVTNLRPWLTNLGWVQFTMMVPVLILGVVVTGAGPHSGDNEVGYRLEFDPVAISKLHALFVWLFVLVVVVLGVGLLAARKTRTAAGQPVVSNSQIKTWGILFVVTLAQGAVGYYQTFNGLPILVVLGHMLGAGLLAVMCVRMLLVLSPAISGWKNNEELSSQII